MNSISIRELETEINQTDSRTIEGRLFNLERDHGKHTHLEYDRGDRVIALLRRLRDLREARRTALDEILDSRLWRYKMAGRASQWLM